VGPRAASVTSSARRYAASACSRGPWRARAPRGRTTASPPRRSGGGLLLRGRLSRGAEPAGLRLLALGGAGLREIRRARPSSRARRGRRLLQEGERPAQQRLRAGRVALRGAEVSHGVERERQRESSASKVSARATPRSGPPRPREGAHGAGPGRRLDSCRQRLSSRREGAAHEARSAAAGEPPPVSDVSCGDNTEFRGPIPAGGDLNGT